MSKWRMGLDNAKVENGVRQGQSGEWGKQCQSGEWG